MQTSGASGIPLHIFTASLKNQCGANSITFKVILQSIDNSSKVAPTFPLHQTQDVTARRVSQGYATTLLMSRRHIWRRLASKDNLDHHDLDKAYLIQVKAPLLSPLKAGTCDTINMASFTCLG